MVVFSGYSFNVKWSNLDPLDVVQLLGNFGHNVQKEFENLLKRVCHCYCHVDDWRWLCIGNSGSWTRICWLESIAFTKSDSAVFRRQLETHYFRFAFNAADFCFDWLVECIWLIDWLIDLFIYLLIFNSASIKQYSTTRNYQNNKSKKDGANQWESVRTQMLLMMMMMSRGCCFVHDAVLPLLTYLLLCLQAGISHGYQDKPCLDPFDAECPSFSPNFGTKEVTAISWRAFLSALRNV